MNLNFKNVGALFAKKISPRIFQIRSSDWCINLWGRCVRLGLLNSSTRSSQREGLKKAEMQKNEFSAEYWILNFEYQAWARVHQPRPIPTFCCDEAGRWGKVESDLFIYFVCRLSSLLSSIGMRWWEKKFWTKGENNFATRELDVLPDLVMSGALQHLDHLHVDYTRWGQEFWIYNISYMHQIAFLWNYSILRM